MARKESPGSEYRYASVEAALASVLEVRPAETGAFRARLRHLRNLGLPKIGNPGSGRKIAYARNDALEMLLALTLEGMGLAPKVAVEQARAATDAQYGDGDFWVMLPGFAMQRDPAQIGMNARSIDVTSTLRAVPSLSVLNMKVLRAQLDQALKEQGDG